MINYNELLETSKQKFQENNGNVFTEYYNFNKEGSNAIAINNIHNFDSIPITDHQKELCSKITLATSIMNRESHLMESLKTWIKFPFKKIVIVDWSSDKPITESIKEHYGIDYKTLDERIEIHRVSDQKYYEHALARNEKMKHTEGWVLSIDSDILLSPRFGRCICLGDNKKLIYKNDRNKNDKALYGTTLFHKDEFDAVGGCNTKFHGWGSEDTTLFADMIDNGCKTRLLVAHTMFHIPHSDYERAINTKHDDIYESLANNNARLVE
jgi:predicted glycosyltransferase involved in capsule biosynthesis